VSDLEYVRVSDITTNGNIRFDVGDVTALATSLSRVGMLQPIQVRRTDDGWVVVAGHRRLAAAQQAGWSEVPVIDITHLVDGTDEGAKLEVQVVENVQRLDLTPVEKAQALLDLKEAGYNQKAISEATGLRTKDVSAYQKLGRALKDGNDEQLRLTVNTMHEAELLASVTEIPEDDLAGTFNVFAEIDEDGTRVYWTLNEAYRAWQYDKAQRDKERQIKEIFEGLEAAGVAVTMEYEGVRNLPFVRDPAEWTDKGEEIPKWVLEGSQSLVMPITDHTGLDCDVVWVTTTWEGVVAKHYCRNPQSHFGDNPTVPALNELTPVELTEAAKSAKDKAAETRVFNAAFRGVTQAWLDDVSFTADQLRDWATEIIINEMPYGFATRTCKLMGIDPGADALTTLTEWVNARGSSTAKRLEGWVLLYTLQSLESSYHGSYGRSPDPVIELKEHLTTEANTMITAAQAAK